MNKTTAGFLRAQKLANAKATSTEALHIEQVVQARERLTPTDFDHEAELSETAFLPYRYMTPYERTEAFYAAYKAHYTTRFRKRRGRDPYGMARNIAALSPRDFTSMWRARQVADSMTAPYDRFVIARFNHADTYGTKQLPTANQIRSDENLWVVENALRDLRDAGRIDPFEGNFDPRFYAINYTGDVQQRAVLDIIEAEVNAAGPASKAKRLARYTNVYEVISDEEAERRFGPELVATAKSEDVGWTSVVPVALDSPQPSPPACIGSYRQMQPICQQCPFKEACVERAETIDAQVMERYGVLNVPALRITEGNRDRKRRQRERERTGATMTDQERARILREAGDPKAKKARKDAKQHRDAKKARKAAKPEGDKP